MRTPLLIPWVLAGCASPRDTGALAFAGRPPRDLLVITLDTARRDHVGRYSGEDAVTPNLDAVLAESVVLDDHRSCSNWTSPSFTCLLTGRSQLAEGFWTASGDPEVPAGPPEGYATLAGLLGGRGYRTTLVTSNQMFSTDFTGVARGFSRQVDVDGMAALGVSARALEELDLLMSARDPWYLHVHFVDPHGNYCAPEEFDSLDGVDRLGLPLGALCGDSYGAVDGPPEEAALRPLLDGVYTGEIRYWDQEFGRLWGELERRGALDDALVVIATDHGQQLFEHGDHGHGLYLGPEENRAVAAFWAENLAPVAWSGATTHEDVAATLFAVFDLAPDEGTDGAVVGLAPDRALRAMNYRRGAPPLLSVVRDGAQLVYGWDGARAFYRLHQDPDARDDAYDAADPEVGAAWGDMDGLVDDVRGTWPHLGPPVDPGP